MTQSQALAIMKTGTHVFLTGEPGSGKTHTINEYAKYLRANGVETAVTASTGIAATHIGGVTIHSWSGIGVNTSLGKHDLERIAKSSYIASRVRKARVLIIEEISMLSASTLSLADAVCRKIKKIPLPFGGMQIVLVGDFFQLPPISKQEILDSPQMTLVGESAARFAYEAPCWKEMRPTVCYLTEQHRQDDVEYLDVLSAIRRNAFTHVHLQTIEKRRIEYESAPRDIPKLFSHNADVDRVNNGILATIPGNARTYVMSSHGNARTAAFLQKSCLSPYELHLKKGASVMFTKNNQKEGFVNGTLGSVDGFDGHTGYPIVRTFSGRRIDVEPMDWMVEEFGEIRARITQIPLRLAWALTVHKSQGMSLDGAVIDLRGVFEFGQGYVALSRVRSLKGLYMLGWNDLAFQVHPDVRMQDMQFRVLSEGAAQDFSKKKKSDIDQLHRYFMESCSRIQTVAKDEPYVKIRQQHEKAYVPWNEDQDNELRDLYIGGATIADLAKEFSRTTGSIRSRLKKKNLLEGA